MPEPVTVEKKPMSFKNEQDRLTALEKVSMDAERIPKGKDADSWRNEVDNLVKEITDAKLDAEPVTPPVAEPPKEDAPKPEEKPEPEKKPEEAAQAPAQPEQPKPVVQEPTVVPVEWTLPEGMKLPQGVELPKNLDAAMRAYVNDQNYINYLKNERLPQLESEYRAKIEALSKQSPQQVEPVAPVMPVVSQAPIQPQPIQHPAPLVPPPSKLADINRLREEINAIPIEKRIDSPEYYSKLSQINDLQAYEIERANQLVGNLQNHWTNNFSTVSKRLEEFDRQQALAKQEQEALKKQEEERKRIEEQNKIVQQGFKELDNFSQAKDTKGSLKHPEFTMSMPYETMQNVYQRDGSDIARVAYGREPSSFDEIDAAMMEYLSGRNIALKQACDARGIVVHPDIPKYLNLTRVHMHYTGHRLDPVNRQWVPNLNPNTKKQITFSNLDSAYHDLKLMDGTWAQELANAANAAAMSVQQQITSAQPAPKMPNSGGTNPGDAEKPIKPEDAVKILEQFAGKEQEIVTAGRKNPKDPRYVAFRAAMETLGQGGFFAENA